MELERYGHGGDLWTATEAYGSPAEGWLDYSSNMNPWGPPEIVGLLIKEHWRDIARYPDPAVRRLRSKLAEVYRIPVESILVGNGAAELIDLVIRVLQPEETALVRPSFSEYEEAVHKAGGRIRDIALSADEQFVLRDVRELTSGTVFLGHPNNPTGRLIPTPVLDELRDSGRTIILDEAFIDFLPDESEFSFVRHASESKQIQVIRSMTKFYAIPGIRLGFLVAHPEIISQLAAIQTQWSVNFLAQMIGEAVLDEHEYARNTRAWLLEERTWLIKRLITLGLTVFPSDVNFLLVALPKHSSWKAPRLQKAMAQRGIMIRDASLFQGLDQAYFRLAIRLREDNERLVKELRECLAS